MRRAGPDAPAATGEGQGSFVDAHPRCGGVDVFHQLNPIMPRHTLRCFSRLQHGRPSVKRKSDTKSQTKKLIMTDTTLIETAQTSKAWPFQEAQRLAKRLRGRKAEGEPVLFETGYGPSGLPHIGTFQEVLRTTLVRKTS